MNQEPDFSAPKPSPIQFDWSFNLGHVGCIVSVIVSVVLAYSSLKAKTDAHDTQIADVKFSVEKVDTKVSKLDDKANESNRLLYELSATVRAEGVRTRAGQLQQ